MFLSSLVKLSYTITHDGLTFSSKKKFFVQLQFQLELPPLDHTQLTPASLDLKQTVLKWIKVVGECKATFISKS